MVLGGVPMISPMIASSRVLSDGIPTCHETSVCRNAQLDCFLDAFPPPGETFSYHTTLPYLTLSHLTSPSPSPDKPIKTAPRYERRLDSAVETCPFHCRRLEEARSVDIAPSTVGQVLGDSLKYRRAVPYSTAGCQPQNTVPGKT